MTEQENYRGTSVPGRNRVLRTLDVLIEQSNSVWVDAEFGDNLNGEVCRVDIPFAGIPEAFTALQSSMAAGTPGTMYISNGNYVMTQQMSSGSDKNITI